VPIAAYGVDAVVANILERRYDEVHIVRRWHRPAARGTGSPSEAQALDSLPLAVSAGDSEPRVEVAQAAAAGTAAIATGSAVDTDPLRVAEDSGESELQGPGHPSLSHAGIFTGTCLGPKSFSLRLWLRQACQWLVITPGAPGAPAAQEHGCAERQS